MLSAASHNLRSAYKPVKAAETREHTMQDGIKQHPKQDYIVEGLYAYTMIGRLLPALVASSCDFIQYAIASATFMVNANMVMWKQEADCKQISHACASYASLDLRLH